MKNQKSKFKIVIVTLAVFLVATAASTSFAHRSGWGHGTGMMSDSQPALTAEQQQKLDAVQTKYSPQLDQIRTSINSKANQYQEARANDNTTVGTLNQLEAQINDLKQQYWTVRDQANTEAEKIAPGTHGSWLTCANNHDHYRGHRMGMMYDGNDVDHHMGYDHDEMMGGGYMSTCR